MNPQMIALLAALQGNRLGGSAMGTGTPAATVPPPGPAPGYAPADGGPPSPPLAGTYDSMIPQRNGDMYNPPFTGQEETGSEGSDQQRPQAGNIPPIPRTPLGALLLPSMISQTTGPVPPGTSYGWDPVTLGMLRT